MGRCVWVGMCVVRVWEGMWVRVCVDEEVCVEVCVGEGVYGEVCVWVRVCMDEEVCGGVCRDMCGWY